MVEASIGQKSTFTTGEMKKSKSEKDSLCCEIFSRTFLVVDFVLQSSVSIKKIYNISIERRISFFNRFISVGTTTSDGMGFRIIFILRRKTTPEGEFKLA
jgi:hypothetical protein